MLGNCGNPQYQVDNTKFENALRMAERAEEKLTEAEKCHDDHFLLQLAEQNELARTIREMAMIEFFSKLAAQAHSTQQVRPTFVLFIFTPIYITFLLQGRCKRFR